MIDKEQILKTFQSDFSVEPSTAKITVDDQGRVNVVGHVIRFHGFRAKLPVSLGTTPSLVCSTGSLTSMEGFPEHIKGGNLEIEENHFTNLTGFPKVIDGSVHMDLHADTPLMRILQSHIGGDINLITPVDYDSDDRPFEIHDFELTEEIEALLNKYKNQGNKGVLRAISDLIERTKNEWLPRYGYDASTNAKL